MYISFLCSFSRFIHMYICTYTHAYIGMYVHTYYHMYMWIFMHICICIYNYIKLDVCIYHICICIHIYVYTYSTIKHCCRVNRQHWYERVCMAMPIHTTSALQCRALVVWIEHCPWVWTSNDQKTCAKCNVLRGSNFTFTTFPERRSFSDTREL